MPDESMYAAYLMVCEHILAEDDHVVSAIRIVDKFTFIRPSFPVPEELQGIPISMLAVARFFPTSSPRTFAASFKLIRPSGEEKPLGDPVSLEIPVGNDLTCGLNVRVSVVVATRETGLHIICFMLDGDVVARAAITLLEKPAVGDDKGQLPSSQAG